MLQSDAACKLDDTHTLRSGIFLQSDHSESLTTSQVIGLDAFDDQTSDVPISIVDNGGKTEWIESVYLQDEWKVIPALTFNYGLRFDKFTAFTAAHQVSPRFNAVWQALDETTVHIGYSRYLAPPFFELVGGETISKFMHTSAAPSVAVSNSPLSEQANYYDVGVQQKITRQFTVGLDTYYKQSHNLIDEGQFGAPIILTPFNYAYGKQHRAEITANFTDEGFNAYLNLAYQSAKGKDIDSAQFNFTHDQLDDIACNYLHLDHEQQYCIRRRVLSVEPHDVQRGFPRGVGAACRLGPAGPHVDSERRSLALLLANQSRRRPCLPFHGVEHSDHAC
ncbi:MAG: TonB-dependent receptor [Steroidobacteraceae bacterium]